MTVGPSYQGVRAERATTLSPSRAEIGTIARNGLPVLASTLRTAAASSAYRPAASASPTASILLTATTISGTSKSCSKYA